LSRTLTFIRCSDNNRASTVLEGYLVGVRQYGCPSRLRTDRGGENVAIADYMITTRGLNRNTVICGPSTHNQRIERLWRDVTKEVLDYYRLLFTYIEEILQVNISDDSIIFILHYLFLSSLNNDLLQFQCTWNNHPLRTEHNRTPHQLLYENAELADVVVNPDEYGVDSSDDEYDSEGDNQVVINSVVCPFSEEELFLFEQRIPPITYTVGLEKDVLLRKFELALLTARALLTRL